MLKILLLILPLCFTAHLTAQVIYNKDSLKQVYLSEKNDSLRVAKHLDYIRVLLYDYEKQKETAAEIEILKKETNGSNNADFIFWRFYFEGLSEYNNYHYVNSIIAIEKMYRVAGRSKISEKAKKAAPSALITLGLNYSMINDLENAQISYQKAVKELQAVSDSSNIVLAYINMGYVFMKSADLHSAKKIFENGLLYMNKSINENYSVPLYASLSMVASRLGNQKESAAYLGNADNLKKKLSSVMADAFCEQARGENEMLKRNYPAAITTFTKAIDFSRRWGDSSSVSEAYEGLGKAYWKSGNNKLALQYILTSKELAVKNQLTDQQKIVLKTLFEFYKAGGYTKEAIATADTLLRLGDSLMVRQNNNRRIIVNALFETEQNILQISSLRQENDLSKLQLKQKNIINYILAGTAISILLISLLSYRNYRQQQKLQQQKITELEKEKLLSATQSLLKGQEDERSRMAKDLHDGLGGMLSGVKLQLGAMKGNLILSEEHGRTFNNALGKLDESISEMRRVAHNMMPEALMKLGLQQALQDYCDGLSQSQPFKINGEFYGLEKRMESSVEIVVYRIVQELLNNVVKHSGATTILAQVMRQDKNLSITVEDNGSGFDTTQTDTLRGTGLKNILSRVDYLKGQLDIQSAPGKGTSVHIDCIIDGDA